MFPICLDFGIWLISLPEGLPPLAQRQERRALPSAASPNSIDSWDFATTVHSPHLTALRKRIAADHGDEGVFSMEEESDPESSTNHNRTVSWRESHLVELEEGHQLDEVGLALEPAASSSTSSSSLHSSSLDEGPPFPEPSSDTEASDVDSSVKLSKSEFSRAGLSSIDEHAAHQGNNIPHQASLAQKFSSHHRPSSSSSQTSESSDSAGKRSIWKKLKTNVKGPSPPSSSANESSPESSTFKKEQDFRYILQQY